MNSLLESRVIKSLRSATERINNFKGRNITVEFALSKETYALKVQHTVDNTNLDSKGVIAGKLQKQETASKT